MSRADEERWDARHAAVTTSEAVPPLPPLPPDALRDRLELLPAGGRALELACGRGAVAVWLAQRGFTVDAVDVSGAGLEAAAALAARSGVGDRVRPLAADLDDGIPASCPGPYDVVVCQRFRDVRLYAAMATRLAPGGLLVVTVLSEAGDEPGPFRAAPGELAAAFGAVAGLEIVSHAEGNGEANLVARRR